MKTLLIFVVLNLSFLGHAQDELSGEIEKLESGNIEQKSSPVPVEPEVSADEIEKELEQEIAEPNVPEKSTPTEEVLEEEDLVEEVVETPKEAPQVAEPVPEPIEPPAPVVEESIEEEIPEPVVDEPIEEEVPEPVVAEPVIEEETPLVEQSVEESVPNDFEERLHRIYSQFYAETTNDEMWTQIAGEKIKEIYVIQQGDTLWDVSATFFGNGHYWPKVWQMNDSITNPHIISPGYQLKFTPGSMETAPSLNIVNNQNQKAGEQVATSTTGQGAAAMELAPYIPPPTKKSNPVLEELPPSLPYIKSSMTNAYDKDGFVIEQKKPQIKSSKVYLSSYLVEEEPTEIGEVVEADDEDKDNVGIYEAVFVQINSGAQKGDKFLVYHMEKKIKDFHGRTMGYPVALEGEIQIDSLVNSEEKIYKAFVIRNISFITVGSFITRGRLITGDLDSEGETASISAEIVGGDFDNKRLLMSTQDVVYLNQGNGQGVKEGQIFSVLKNQKSRNKNTLVEDLRDQVAQIKVIKTTENRATAIVLQASDEIRTGDYIGSRTQASQAVGVPLDSDEESDSDQEIDENESVDEDIEE